MSNRMYRRTRERVQTESIMPTPQPIQLYSVGIISDAPLKGAERGVKPITPSLGTH